MSKKRKMIIFLIIFLIIILFIFIYVLLQYKTYTGTITKIDLHDNYIFVSKTPEIIEEAKNYDVSTFGGNYENAKGTLADYYIIVDRIKSSNGNDLDISKLKEGDKIFVIYKKFNKTTMENPIQLRNVKYIKIME